MPQQVTLSDLYASPLFTDIAKGENGLHSSDLLILTEEEIQRSERQDLNSWKAYRRSSRKGAWYAMGGRQKRLMWRYIAAIRGLAAD